MKTPSPIRYDSLLLEILSVSIILYSYLYAISMVQVFNFDPIHLSLQPASVGGFLQYRTSDIVNAKLAGLAHIFLQIMNYQSFPLQRVFSVYHILNTVLQKPSVISNRIYHVR